LALWRWFARRDGRTMPDVALPPKARKTPEAWVPEEVERLDKAARAADWWIGGVPANLYFPALIGVAINTGERHGAIHHLAPGDIHLEKRLVYFRAEHRKGGATDARKPISAETAHDLRLLLEASPADVFNVVQLTSTYPPMRRLLLEAGLKATRNNMFHAFRRYHATQVAIAGGDPTTALGHSDPSLARKSYVDPTQLPAVTPGVRPVAKPTPAPRPGWLARITGRAAS
ncbi:hypothetical protein, partial [Botrimarina sp.]|uniref:hypothetical protein n=1 Tax=Botrimarina sp. TaxID=2795802 RepID=UPI0032EE7058